MLLEIYNASGIKTRTILNGIQEAMQIHGRDVQIIEPVIMPIPSDYNHSLSVAALAMQIKGYPLHDASKDTVISFYGMGVNSKLTFPRGEAWWQNGALDTYRDFYGNFGMQYPECTLVFVDDATTESQRAFIKVCHLILLNMFVIAVNPNNLSEVFTSAVNLAINSERSIRQ